MENLFDMGMFSAEALSNDTVSFVAWYEDGQIITCNPPFVELTGYTVGELDNKRWPCDFAPPQTCDEIQKSIVLLKLGMKAYRYEGICIRKDGSTVPIDMFVHRHNDPAGKFLFFYSFISDISQRKRVEDALIASKAQAELYLDLMGHDINNLNHAGMGFLEMALSHAHNAGEKELIEKAFDAMKSSSRIIDNVRKLQRIQKHEMKYEPVDICQLLTEIKSAYSDVYNRQVTITLTPACDCYVKANGLLRDVFLNLVGNSIKHSTGAITIDIIVLDIFEDSRRYCKVIVQDNGPGIPGELKNKLFTRLQRDQTKAYGRGLGLYLAKTLIDDFGGRIWVEDRVPGDYTKGTRFVVILPTLEK